MVTRKLQRRHMSVVALYGALALATTGVPIVASSLTAVAKTVTGDATDLRVSNIDGTRLGRLMVIEPQGQDSVVAGVKFTVARIKGIDLTTEAGWNKAAALTDAEAAAADKEPGITKVVDAEGRAIFEGLPVGVYYVTESDPDNVPEGYEATKPFVITLPVARKDPHGWQYDVSVYAKAQPSTPSTTTTTTTPTRPTTPTEPTTSTMPSTSVETTTPVTTTSQPPSTSETIRRNLASTGANVIGLALVGFGLLLLGGFIVARRRKTDEGGRS